MIRNATPDDLPLVEELWRAFAAEVPDAPWREDDTDDDVRALTGAVREDVVLVAGEREGLLVATMRGARLGFVDVLYVAPAARGRGVARALLREAAAQLQARGADHDELEVLASNDRARTLYERWGFAPVELTLAAPTTELVERLGAPARGPTFGSVHVQTDDVDAVGRAVEKILPRLGRSRLQRVSDVWNGWVQVRSTVTDDDPSALRRLAKELSYTGGGVALALGVDDGAVVHYVLFDRGAIVDEYRSVPEYHGPLPPGEVVALGANPTIVSRLTGAAPSRVREVARTASSPSELPPWNELYEQIADLMGVRADAHPL